MQDVIWQHFCEQHLATIGSDFVPAVSAHALLAYSKLQRYKELFLRLRKWQIEPVGLWWRRDETTQPHGQLLLATASGSGQWSWYPLLDSGFALWDTPLAVTDLQDTACVPPLMQANAL